MCTVGGGAKSAGPDTGDDGTAAGAILPHARDGTRFDRATQPTQLARECHPAENCWSVLPAEECMLAHSVKC